MPSLGAEVETSKGVIEIEIFEDGVVKKLLVEEETDCKVGTPLALIRSEGETVKEEVPQEETSEPSLENTSSERLKVSPN